MQIRKNRCDVAEPRFLSDECVSEFRQQLLLSVLYNKAVYRIEDISFQFRKIVI